MSLDGKRLLLVAAVALIDSDGRILLHERPPGSFMAGYWEFPGGKLEAGETPEAAAVREIREELGLDLTDDCLAPFCFASHTYPEFHLLMPLFVCRRWSGIPEPREGQTLKWVFPRDMAAMNLLPADFPLAAALRSWL